MHLGSAALDWPPRLHRQAAERGIAEQVARSASCKQGPWGLPAPCAPPSRTSLLPGPLRQGSTTGRGCVCVAVSGVPSQPAGADMGRPLPAPTSSAVLTTRPGCRSRGPPGLTASWERSGRTSERQGSRARQTALRDLRVLDQIWGEGRTPGLLSCGTSPVCCTPSLGKFLPSSTFIRT